MRPIDADYILSALGVFTSEEPESANFMHGIKTAREIVEDAPTVGGWISVQDRLPMEFVDVLLCAGNEAVFMGCRSGNGWIIDTAGLTTYSAKVTHWMPLPKNPEEVVRDD